MDFLWPVLPVADIVYAFRHSNLLSGKLFVLLLFLSSIYSWSVMVAKNSELRKAHRESRKFLQVLRREKDPLSLFVRRVELEASPLFRIYQSACMAVGMELESRGDGPDDLFSGALAGGIRLNSYQLTAIRNAADRSIADEALLLESRMGFLATAASVAPLLGLLGTIWGVIDTFSAMGVSGSASIASVAPGISGALMTTFFALVVAIPSSVGYNYLANEIRTLAVQMDNFADEFLSGLQRQYLKE